MMRRDHETEIKLRVPEARRLKRRLRKLGFKLRRAREFERNFLFDFPDLRLRKARCLLRVRFSGPRVLLTFKGAPLLPRAYKIRREIETEAKDGRRLREVLESLGLRETFRYEKFRTTYAPRGLIKRLAGRELLVDETPLGDFIELEGPREWIDRVARRLGYRPEEYITASYAALYFARCRERHRKPGNMVFHIRKS